MTAMQRRKGQRGERELFGLLSDRLGTVVRRNVDQARQGGADGLDVQGWAVEVKRQQRAFIEPWWRQTLDQAAAVGRKPILFYRANHKPWRALVRLADVCPCPGCYGEAADHERVELTLDAAVLVIRESLE
jgi:hypothetical protein